MQTSPEGRQQEACSAPQAAKTMTGGDSRAMQATFAYSLIPCRAAALRGRDLFSPPGRAAIGH